MLSGKEWFAFFSSLIIILVVAIISIIVGKKVKRLKPDDKPGKILTLFIVGIKSFNKFVKGNIGKHWTYTAPFVLTLGVFIFLANISGLFLLETPTKYASITLALAIFSVFTVQSTGVVSQGWRHIKTWFKPMFFMFPLNILSDLTPLISMTLRLFGNIVSGASLLLLAYGVSGYLAPLVALPLHILFDIGFGLIQTVVFVLLTVIFSSNKVKEEDFQLNLEKKGA